MIGNRRFSAAVFCLILIIGIFSSVIFVALEAEHECSWEDCPVCACLDGCINCLRAVTAILPCEAVLLTITVNTVEKRYYLLFVPDTLVKRRVRLND